jgi:hypothetical protein
MKIIAILALVLLAIPSMAFAETISTEAQAEARLAASTIHGAEVRLLQLERAITRAIVQGERIINYAEEQNFSEANIEVMIDVISDIRALRVQVQEVDPASEIVVREFVALRQEANVLTQKFRRAAHELFSEEDVAYLRGYVRIEADAAAEVRARDAQIQQRLCAHNAQQVQAVLNAMGISQESLVAEVRACEKSKDQAMLELRKLYNSLEERRKQATQKEVAEYRARLRVQQIAEVEASGRVLQDLIDRRVAIVERERLALEVQRRDKRAHASVGVSARTQTERNQYERTEERNITADVDIRAGVR